MASDVEMHARQPGFPMESSWKLHSPAGMQRTALELGTPSKVARQLELIVETIPNPSGRQRPHPLASHQKRALTHVGILRIAGLAPQRPSFPAQNLP